MNAEQGDALTGGPPPPMPQQPQQQQQQQQQGDPEVLNLLRQVIQLVSALQQQYMGLNNAVQNLEARLQANEARMVGEAEQLLHAIYELSDLESLKLYIKKGYDVYATQQQSTLLHVAALQQDIDSKEKCLVEVLIERGLAVDARDKQGRTALMLCRPTEADIIPSNVFEALRSV